MAFFYFNNAVDLNLDTVGNWWSDDTFSTPAGALPGVDDYAVLGFILVNQFTVDSGTCIAGTVYSFAWIAGGTFSGNFTANARVSAGTFNGSFDTYGDFSFTDEVTIEGGTFNGDFTVNSYTVLRPTTVNGYHITLNGRFRIQSDPFLVQNIEPDYPVASDVRAGVEYADGDLIGTLGGGTLMIVVE